jgi:chaperonin GroES
MKTVRPINETRRELAMNMTPLNDRVLVKRIEQQDEVRGGIIIPDTAKEKPQEAEVVSVGPGKLDDSGNRLPMSVKTGDRVLVGKYSGTDIKLGDEEHTILREDEVLAIIQEETRKAKKK